MVRFPENFFELLSVGATIPAAVGTGGSNRIKIAAFRSFIVDSHRLLFVLRAIRHRIPRSLLIACA